MVFFLLNKKKLFVSLIIALVALVGDKNSENQNNRVIAAICDNSTHGLIGIFTWVGMFVAKTSYPTVFFFIEIILCGIFSSLMDIDHFIAAKSWNLKDATSLKNRPFLHCTTLVATIVTLVLLPSIFQQIRWMYKLGWLLAAAFFSHHIRDSKRRGFWLWPFGSTSPTPFAVYIVAQMLLPHFFSVLFSQFAPNNNLSESFFNPYQILSV